MDNIRYVKTEINGVKAPMCMNSCNLCPLLGIDREKMTANCLRFKRTFRDIEPQTSNVIKKIYGYKYTKGVYLPLEIIEIPNWCLLSDKKESVLYTSLIFVKTKNNGYRICYDNLDVLNIINSQDIEYGENGIDLIFKDKIKTTEPFGLLPEKTQKNNILIEKCSCCGEMKEKTDRNKYYGMCEDCWNKNKNNEQVKYFSYINNFRLKRKSTWIKKIDKKLDIVKIF